MKKDNITELEMLQFIYRNAEMGIIGIDDVIDKVEDKSLKKVMQKERIQYKEITQEAKDLINKYGADNEETGMMAKLGTKLMSEFSLMTDDSSENIAKMMLEGTNKGIIAIVEKINAYDNSDVSIVVLANKLKNTLEKNIEELKKFL